MNPPTEPAESIPTDGNELAAHLLNYYRYNVQLARKALAAQEAAGCHTSLPSESAALPAKCS